MSEGKFAINVRLLAFPTGEPGGKFSLMCRQQRLSGITLGGIHEQSVRHCPLLGLTSKAPIRLRAAKSGMAFILIAMSWRPFSEVATAVFMHSLCCISYEWRIEIYIIKAEWKRGTIDSVVNYSSF
jgi:hypothetical protein